MSKSESKASGWTRNRSQPISSAGPKAHLPSPFGDICSVSVVKRLVAPEAGAHVADSSVATDSRFSDALGQFASGSGYDSDADNLSVADSEYTLGSLGGSDISFGASMGQSATIITDGMSTVGDDYLDDTATVFSGMTKPWGRDRFQPLQLPDIGPLDLDGGSAGSAAVDEGESTVLFLRMQAIQSCWAHNADMLQSQLADAGEHGTRLLNETAPPPAALAYRFPLLGFALAAASPRCVQVCLDAGADVRGANAAFDPALLRLMPLGAAHKLRPLEKPKVAAALAECLSILLLSNPTAAAAVLRDAVKAAAAVDLPLSRPFHAVLRAGVDMAATEASSTTSRPVPASVAQHFITQAASADLIAIAELLLAEPRGTSSLDTLVSAAAPTVPVADVELLDFQWAPSVLLREEAVSQLRVPLPDGSHAPLALSAIPARAEAVWLFPAAPAGLSGSDKASTQASAALAAQAAARCRLTRERLCERDGCYFKGNVMTARAWRAGWDGSAIEALHLVHVVSSGATPDAVLDRERGAAATGLQGRDAAAGPAYDAASAHTGATGSLSASKAAADAAASAPAEADAQPHSHALSASPPPLSLGHVLAVFLQRPASSSQKRTDCALPPGASSRLHAPAAGGAGAGVAVSPAAAGHTSAPALEVRYADGMVPSLKDFWASLMLPVYDDYHLVLHAQRCKCMDANLLRESSGLKMLADGMVLSMRGHPFYAETVAPAPAPLTSLPSTKARFGGRLSEAEETDLWKFLCAQWRQLSSGSMVPPRRPCLCPQATNVPHRAAPVLFGAQSTMREFAGALKTERGRNPGVFVALPMFTAAHYRHLLRESKASRLDGDGRPMDDEAVIACFLRLFAAGSGASGDSGLLNKPVLKLTFGNFLGSLLHNIVTDAAWADSIDSAVPVSTASHADNPSCGADAGAASGGAGRASHCKPMVAAAAASGAGTSHDPSEPSVLVSLFRFAANGGSVFVELPGCSPYFEKRGASLRCLAQTQQDAGRLALQAAGIPISESLWKPWCRGAFVCCAIPATAP